MQQFLSTHLKIKKEVAADIIGNMSDAEVIDHLLSLRVSPKPVSDYAFRQARIYLEAERMRIPMRHIPELAKALPELSLLELRATCHHNPFYLLFAFDVDFNVCLKVQQDFGVSLGPNIAAHAKLWSMLKEKNAIFIDEAHNILKERYNVDVTQELNTVEPFPRSLLQGHPLLPYDPYVESSATLRSHIPDYRAILSSIRERKFLENRIYASRGRYMIHDRSKQFVDAIDGIYGRAKKLESGIKKSYKRLKEQEE